MSLCVKENRRYISVQISSLYYLEEFLGPMSLVFFFSDTQIIILSGTVIEKQAAFLKDYTFLLPN